jgi:hypothetical protein
MMQMQTTATESPALDGGQPIPAGASGGRSLPTQVISFAIGDDDNGMITVIDLANLLSILIDDDDAIVRPAMSA